MSKKTGKGNVINMSSLTKGLEKFLKSEKKTFNITEAVIKDDFCTYKYEVIEGVGLGDVHGVKGSGRVKDTMLEAFAKFAVHLAVIDDAFKHSNIEIDDIDKFHAEELTTHYRVNGFKIKGDADNESLVLMGNKYVTNGHGRMELETPKIMLDNLSSYKWYNELKAAADAVRHEVAMYKEGNYIPVKEDEEDQDDSQQLTIMDGAKEGIDLKAGEV